MKATPTNNPLEDEDRGEFAVFDSNGAIAAYHYAKGGAQGEEMVRLAFAPNPNPKRTEAGFGPKESLTEAAEELEGRGLNHVAAILRDLAKDAISGFDLPPEWYVERGAESVEWWRRKWLLDRKVKSGELWRELRREQAERQRQSQIKPQKPPSHQH